MYKRHNVWDEDKVLGSGSYGSHGSDQGAHYRHNELYGSKDKDKKIQDDYKSSTRQNENEEKKEDQKEPNIDDAVNQQEKYKKDDQVDSFNLIKEGIKTEHVEEDKKPKSKKHYKSIEEAINKAIEEERETVYVD